MRDLFLIDPKVTYLNHGSYGACPKSVFLDYQNFQKKSGSFKKTYFQNHYLNNDQLNNFDANNFPDRIPPQFDMSD